MRLRLRWRRPAGFQSTSPGMLRARTGRQTRRTRRDEMDRTSAKQAADRIPTRSARQDEEDGTRDRILKTAERLFAERGFNGVSVRALAGAAKVNIASIGYHFHSKEGLLAAVYRRHCEPLIEERLRGLAAASGLAG